MDVVAFGRDVKEAREAKKMTLTSLAKLVGFKQPYLSKLEAGILGHEPNPQLVRALIDALDLEADFDIPEESPRHRKPEDLVVNFVQEKLAKPLPPSILKRFGDECRAAADQLRTRFYRAETAATMYQVAKVFYGQKQDDAEEASMLYGMGRCEYDLARGRSAGRSGDDLQPNQQLHHFKQCLSHFAECFQAMKQRYDLGFVTIEDTLTQLDGYPDFEEARIAARNVHEFVALIAYTARAVRRVGLHVRDGTLEIAEGLLIEPDYIYDVLSQADLRWRDEQAADLGAGLTKEAVFRYNNQLAIRLLNWSIGKHIKLADDLEKLDLQLWRWATAMRSEQIREERDRDWYETGTYDTNEIARKFEHVAEQHRIRLITLRNNRHERGWQSVDAENRWLLAGTYVHREVGRTYQGGNAKNEAAAYWHFTLAQLLLPDEDEAERGVIADTFMGKVFPHVQGNPSLMAQVALLKKKQINKTGIYDVKPPDSFSATSKE